MSWQVPFPDLKNDPTYLEGRLSNDETNISNNTTQLAQIMKQSSVSEPTTGVWQLGDKVWNSNPQAGGNLGWICVQAGTFGTGTPPVFKQFGIISA